MSLKTFIRDSYQNFISDVSARKLKHRQEEQFLKEVNQFIAENCSNMSIASGYRKKLIQSIRHALTHISGLIDQIPGPIELDPKRWADQPVLNSMFLNPEEILSRLKSTRDLKVFFETAGIPETFALLTAGIHEKSVFTTETTGEMIQRNVSRKAIYFDDFQILVPAHHINDSKVKIQHLALISLCRQPLRETKDLLAWKKKLEEQQNLLEFKLTAEKTDTNTEDFKETTQLLSEIKTKINTINKQTNATGEHLERITRMFETPENYLTLKTVMLKLDYLGIQRDSTSTEKANEFSIAEFQFGQSPKRAAVWVRIKRESI